MNNFVTKQMLRDAVAERWKHTYFNNPEPGVWRDTITHDSKETYEKLLALRNPTNEDIAAIIGNASWTRLQCDSCRKDREALSSFSIYDHSLYLCKDCLEKALGALNENLSTVSEAMGKVGDRSGV